MGLLMTMILGLVGSVVDGSSPRPSSATAPRIRAFTTGGLITSAIGAVIVLGIYVAYCQRKVP
jgi:uncharacterized membrane protein YeaQ/YmgE (transglycosylase-associated protein family)